MQSGLLDSGFSCVLQMATGSGKTWLSQVAMDAVLQRGQRAIYLAPLRALASELGETWQRRFPTARIGVFTGDMGSHGGAYPVSFQDARLLVMTPERLDICTRNWRKHWGWLPEVDLVVVDEIHLLGDGRRGARLEGALSRFRRLNPFARTLGLSATLGNREELADWLDAIDFASDWRPVPLQWRIVRYRRAEDKPLHLAEEVGRCRQSGGKSLVFVQSRRRAELLAETLRAGGLRAAHHHAGLDRVRRGDVEAGFRGDALDVVVATSTLEMGLNLPVRQVVLYDLQEFDGGAFVPLPTNTVWQRVGRAGRPGLDGEGEAVLLAPAWDRAVSRYEEGRFERIRSRLDDERALGEQVIVEVAGGYGRSLAQVERILMASLAAKQGRLAETKVRRVVRAMLEAGMLEERADPAREDRPHRLTVTSLGRVAVRHMLYPATLIKFQRVCAGAQLSFFDLLLLAASTQDCEPLLPVDYEELDDLAARVGAELSVLLALERPVLEERLGVGGKRLLASIKMALALRALTRCDDSARVAQDFGCYPFELDRLAESVERLLLALGALVKETNRTSEGGETAGWQTETVTLPELIDTLGRMVAARLDETAVTLTRVRGIGPKLARRLVAQGIADIARLASATPADLVKVGGISAARAERLVGEARLVATMRGAESYREESGGVRCTSARNPNAPDPYRLRRARELKVRALGSIRFRVTGGTDPHEIRELAGELSCDCPDFAKGQRNCKHVLAVRLMRGDRALAAGAATLANPGGDDALSLLDLWMESMPGLDRQVAQGWR